ncbi:emp24/gp25L/p24 family protein [Thermococcus sp. ES12]|uniref:emp24/gp25L/p24 family protein n=1 Tax=Thermococcus sp. ES12 TaxID=1638246 RepID=UPI001431EA90|nr:emp24/gp25L/p24 family protein [Thermococcus sp. ES12]NJE75966.1 emp24/gp25L/p24 family protein [Thermococcus sp. ES12]
MADIPEPYKRLDREPKSLKALTEPKSLKPPSGIRVRKRRERTWGWLIGLLVIGLIVSVAGLAIIEDHKFYKSWHEEFTVLPKEAKPWGWRLSKGTILEINATVSGGNRDIRIYVVDDRTGQTVKDFGRLVSPISIRFEAPEKGNYTVYFDNTFSTLMPKGLKVTSTLYVTDINFWGFIMMISGVVMVVLAVIFIIIGNVPVLTLEDGEAVYEFKVWRNGKIKIWVNGVEVPEQVGKHAVFKIGPNDEHTLEIERKFSWTWTWQWIFRVDGREVGRLP